MSREEEGGLRERRGSLTIERRAWLLKKAKTDRPWEKTHHTPRFFVSRGSVLSYYERQVTESSPEAASGLRGVINCVMSGRSAHPPTPPHRASPLTLS